MKKPLILIVLAVSLTSCDALNDLLPKTSIRNDSISIENLDYSDGINMSLFCNEDLQMKRHDDQEGFSVLLLKGLTVGCSTIKLENKKITFYDSPVYGQSQLKEVEKSKQDMYFFEQKFDFIRPDDEYNYDFIYLTDFAITSSDSNSKFANNLRVAFMESDTVPYFIFSQDKDGTLTKTACNLDLNMDGELDKDSQGELITYTTGSPSYTTDAYEKAVVKANDAELDKIPEDKVVLPINKTLTIRVWIEGWDIENSDSMNDLKLHIKTTFNAHKMQ